MSARCEDHDPYDDPDQEGCGDSEETLSMVAGTTLTLGTSDDHDHDQDHELQQQQQETPRRRLVIRSPPPRRSSAVKKVVTVISPTQELVSSGPNERNWRGILIALLVIVLVLAMIALSIAMLSPPDEGPRVRGAKLTLDDVLGPRLRAPPFNGSWVSDTELVFRDHYGGVSLLNAENLTTRIIMTNSTFRQLNAVDYRISSDLKYVLLIYNRKKVWRYSYQASYQVYEVEAQTKYPLSPAGLDGSVPRLQLAVWAPAGSRLAFVHDNDLYYCDDPRRRPPLRLTTTGVPGVLFNGVPDWLYEEEILQSGAALWWSPDSRYLLFATFDDSSVGELRYPWYGSGTGHVERPQYPQLRSLRYPKVGTPNPVVTLRVVDLQETAMTTTSTIWPASAIKNVRPPSQLPTDHYLTAATWISNTKVCAVWMNRAQNISLISVCKPPLWNCEQVHEQRSHAWLEPAPAPLFSADGESFVAVLTQRDAAVPGYPHVVRVDIAEQRTTPLTYGAWHVTAIAAWDQFHHLVYFVATEDDSPGVRHIYRVGSTGNELAAMWECLSCVSRDMDSFASGNETTDMEQECLYAWPHFSPGISPHYYVLECLGPGPPFHALVETTSNARIAMLDDLKYLRDRLQRIAVPQVKTFKVQVPGGFHAHVKLHLPPGLREYEDMVFPLILHVCGAPGSQLVSSLWNMGWPAYLASRRNFIVAEVDGRGSGFQGDYIRHQIHRKFGSIEIRDQIDVVEYLTNNLKFVDRDHVALWGWGYGGFASAMILSNDDHRLFRCGISIAPITSWAYYDSAYTERYMGLPSVEDNYVGYEQANVTNRAGRLQDKMFLLIHGTADHTVHYQQSMLLVSALTREGVLFRHQTYPDEGNAFSGVKQHLYRVMEAFFDDCFGPLDFEEWEMGSNLFSRKP
ncbi:inactive dipeptidyl peptidase 10-like [Schistocerca serialis cubense]|uniref:inactive dipeptidyl peptidase 10-like n=1 Tax=Schistocerca serialis cubense TaxID=2023355 RepID=UPI00214F0297|nr:inactive dipeptidyl peptidase 10-like [Schistocerca serialis cubense]